MKTTKLKMTKISITITLTILALLTGQLLAKESSDSYHEETSSFISSNVNGDVKVKKSQKVNNNGEKASFSTFTHKKNGKVIEHKTEGDKDKFKQIKQLNKHAKGFDTKIGHDFLGSLEKIGHGLHKMKHMHKKALERLESDFKFDKDIGKFDVLDLNDRKFERSLKKMNEKMKINT
jgi:hypothetical protein